MVARFVALRGLALPDLPDPPPLPAAGPRSIDLSRVGAVIFASGYRPDYGSWVHVPGTFDDLGLPVHIDGAGSAAPGLFFIGVHFLRTRKSSLLYGVAEDATIVARQVAARHGAGLAGKGRR